MAPEIGKGEYGKEIDIYAVGVILYEMLTGAVPFEGESTQEIIMKHLTMDPDLSALPQEYHRVVGKSLRKDPQKRYSSIAEMVRDLPWPEVAASANQIVDRHVVGGMNFPAGLGNKPKSTAGYKADSAKAGSATAGSAKVGATNAEASEGDLAQLSAASLKAQLPPAIMQGGFGADGKTQEQPVANLAVSNVTAGNVVGADGGQVDEPMALAVRSGLTDLNQWWNEANVSTPVRLGAIVVTGIVVIQNSTWLLAVSVALATVYLLYYAARRYVLSPAVSSTSADVKASKRLERQVVRTRLINRPVTDQLAELTGSLLLGAVSVIVISFFVLAVGVRAESGLADGVLRSLFGWSIFTWQTVLSVLSVWVMIGTTKQWTWKPGEFLPRSLMLAFAGAIVGATAFYSASVFEIDLARITVADFSAKQTESLVYRYVGKLPGFVLCFSALFALTLLGRYTDPLRRTRLSVMNVILSLMVGIVGSHLLNLPLTVVCMFAVVMSVSVQLASPWLHPDQIQAIGGSPADQVGA